MKTDSVLPAMHEPASGAPVRCCAWLDATRPNSMAEDSKMLDHLLEVQRILTRNKDHARLALLHPLTDALQDEYLSHLERTVNGCQPGDKKVT
jgi:hypothetical protein